MIYIYIEVHALEHPNESNDGSVSNRNITQRHFEVFTEKGSHWSQIQVHPDMGSNFNARNSKCMKSSKVHIHLTLISPLMDSSQFITIQIWIPFRRRRRHPVFSRGIFVGFYAHKSDRKSKTRHQNASLRGRHVERQFAFFCSRWGGGGRFENPSVKNNGRLMTIMT